MSHLTSEPLPKINPALVEVWGAIPADERLEFALTRHDWDNVMVSLLDTQRALEALGRIVGDVGAAANVRISQEGIDQYFGSITSGNRRLARFIETVMARAAEARRGR